MSKIIVDLGVRKVFWNIEDGVAALLLQTLISALGPATGDLDENYKEIKS